MTELGPATYKHNKLFPEIPDALPDLRTNFSTRYEFSSGGGKYWRLSAPPLESVTEFTKPHIAIPHPELSPGIWRRGWEGLKFSFVFEGIAAFVTRGQSLEGILQAFASGGNDEKLDALLVHVVIITPLFLMGANRIIGSGSAKKVSIPKTT